MSEPLAGINGLMEMFKRAQARAGQLAAHLYEVYKDLVFIVEGRTI